MGRTVVIEESWQDNTKRDVYQVRHFSNGVNINLLEDGTVIKFNKVDRLHVIDDENGDDYTVYVFRYGDLDMYYTSSEFFAREALEIFESFYVDEENADCAEARVLKKQSKNRKTPSGESATFLTCELV